jgi:hypothetical protein
MMFRTGERFYPKVKQYFAVAETMEAAFEMIEKDRSEKRNV